MSKWLEWQPGGTRIIQNPPSPEVAKVPKLGFATFATSLPGENPIIRVSEPRPETPPADPARTSCPGPEQGAGYYSVGVMDGRERSIHPPKSGVTPEVRPLPRRQVEIPCFHCAGAGRCDCITCGTYQARMEWVAGPCVPCEYRARQKAKVQ